MKQTDLIKRKDGENFPNGEKYAIVAIGVEPIGGEFYVWLDKDTRVNYNDVELVIPNAATNLITAKRNQQLMKHNRSLEYDLQDNAGGQLEQGALFILLSDYDENAERFYPNNWSEEFLLKVSEHSQKDRLIIAASLLAAEIDRLTAIGQ